MQRLDAVSRDLTIERCIANAEHSGGFEFVSLALCQRLVDGDFLHLGEIEWLFWLRICESLHCSVARLVPNFIDTFRELYGDDHAAGQRLDQGADAHVIGWRELSDCW